MLYYLSLLTHTDQLGIVFSPIQISPPSAPARRVVTALAGSPFLINPMLIRWLKVKQGKGQPIRSDGPQRHILEKAGTPNHGRALLILIPWDWLDHIVGQPRSNRYVWIALLV